MQTACVYVNVHVQQYSLELWDHNTMPTNLQKG